MCELYSGISAYGCAGNRHIGLLSVIVCDDDQVRFHWYGRLPLRSNDVLDDLFTFCIFLPFPFAHKVLCCLGILVFSFYLIYDTQMVMGNGQLALGIDDYVFGALQLYIDIVQIFLYILQLIGRRD